MLKELRSEDKYEKRLRKVVKKLENGRYENIRADLEGYEQPAKLINKATNTAYIPDVTAVKDGNKYYFEIAMKTDDELKLAGKWNLLSTLASMKDGMLKIFAPHGQMAFTKRLTKQFNIQCEMASMPA